MLKIFTLLILCLWISQGEAHREFPIYFEPLNACDDTTTTYQLCRDFRDIRNLIDANTLVYYISQGYYNDKAFRNAMDFIKTDQFQSVSQQLADSSVYQTVLKHFSDAGVNTETISSISNIFNCLMISIPEYGDEAEFTNGEMSKIVLESRSLNDIVQNLVKEIPKSKLRHLLREKMYESREFANFYRVLRSRSFRHDVNRLLKSYTTRYPINVLKRHNIDLQKLLEYAYKIIDLTKN
ncbi:uncharacterized protein LOC105225427 [Bactrocera dorsalis]|uniref:Uncharacterized protein LOC105225427 n=1 Tax=Bactrocera dorsalis TaxID=27457 RepID=A0A6I9V198_BACDO|nr:uncharacterized protein LOC105225427 [Bactrocera dorsalis]